MGRELGKPTSFFSRVHLRMQNSMTPATPPRPASALVCPPPPPEKRREGGPAPLMTQRWAILHQQQLKEALQKADEEHQLRFQRQHRLRMQKADEEHQLQLGMQADGDAWRRRVSSLRNHGAFDDYMRDLCDVWVDAAAGSSAETETEPTSPSYVPPHGVGARDDRPLWEQDSRAAPAANGWKED